MSQPSESQVFNERYEILRHLARGGMAEVYLAHDLMLDRRVALKVLFQELSTDRNFVERFRREAQAAANLTHPNIVSIYDWGEENGTYFIVMEYIEGQTLGQLVRSEGPLLAERAADVGADVAAALHYAHQNGVVHRDVKPGNVLVSNTGAVKVTDFGIARAANTDHDLTQTGSVMGTATYFSPEQAQGQRVDARSDIYSLGIVLYELVVGRPPFQGDNAMAIAYKHVREEAVPPRRHNPDVPAEFEAVVLQSMAKNPNDRYLSADELRNDLLRFRQGRAVLANPTVAVPVVREEPATVLAAPVTQTLEATTIGEPVATRRGGPPPPSRGVGPFVVLLLVMLAVLGGLLWLFGRQLGLFGDSSGELVTMPNVVGKTMEEATAEVEALGLEVATENEVVEDEAQVGRVIDQDPDASARVDEGARVTLRLGVAPETAKVPNLVGRDVDAAIELVEALGFTARTEEETSATVAEDAVIRQDPAADSDLAKGSEVLLVISAGKAQKAVPDVVGKDQVDAAAELAAAGFKVRRTNEASKQVDSGEVIRTDPAAGQKIDEGSQVTMVVSSGPEKAAVPSVIGKTVSEARAAIEAAGFVFAQGSDVPSNVEDNGRVVQQSPSGGAQAEPGATVTVRVGRFSASSTTTTSTTAP